MADPIQSSLAGLSPALGVLANPTGTAAAATGPEQVKNLASQFEGLLLSQLMKDLKMSLGGEEDNPDGNDTGPLGDVMTSEFGLQLSRAGGFGLSQSLMSALMAQTGVTSAKAAAVPVEAPEAASVDDVAPAVNDSPVPVSPTVVAPLATPAATPAAGTVSGATAKLPVGRISSGFGWRNDPIDGTTKFHKGLDVAVPQGSTVYAPAAGRVASVGNQPGYGLTVVVDHGNGVETRYAHLSAASVVAGESVAAGDPLALSGNTGRSTGAHLHFEVLQNGQAVDPSAWVSSVLTSAAAPAAGPRPQ